MGHAKLAAAIASQLARLRKARGRALRVLDLGSGDAGCLTRALAAEAEKLCPSSPSSSSSPAAANFIIQYTAVDESEPALALAAKNVEKHLPGTEGRFFVGDLLSATEQSRDDPGAAAAASAPGAASEPPPPPPPLPPPPPSGGYDAIVASLSAHHLSTERGKPALVAAARRALFAPAPTGGGVGASKGGAEASPSPSSSSSLLIIADIFLNDDEPGKVDTVDAWRQRSCAVIREQWPLRVPGGRLSAEEAVRISSHVGTCDIPTTVSSYAAFAEKAGFKKCEKVVDVEEELGIRVIVMEA